MNRLFALALSLTAVTVPLSRAFAVGSPPPPPSGVKVTSNTFSTGRADGLKVFNYQIGTGTTLSFRTTGCDVENDIGNLPDTVIYLLEATGSPNQFITRAFNDDFSGLGFCSQVSITNTTLGPKQYVVIVAARHDTRIGEISMRAQIGQGSSFVSTIYQPMFVGGGRWERGWNSTASCNGALHNADTFSTVPVRAGAFGGGNQGLSDPQLWAIDKTPGHKSYRDLDAGIERHALLDLAGKPACQGACDIVVGATNTTPSAVCSNADNACNRGVAKIWAQEQNGCDSDTDGIVDLVETAEGTDPENRDTDRDGITDEAEFMGLHNGITLSGLELGTDNLAYKGSDAKQQDLFLLMDWWASATESFEPYPTIGSDLNAIFRNDTGFTGRSINVHAFHGANVETNGTLRIATLECPEGGLVPGAAGGATFSNVYTKKPQRIAPLQRPVYHYAVFADRAFVSAGSCSSGNVANHNEGISEIVGNDIVVAGSKNLATDPSASADGRTIPQLSVLVHELGHNLIPGSLLHNGNDGPAHDNSCIHASAMNKRFTFGWGETGGVTLLESGASPTGLAPAVMRRFGYSNGTCASLEALRQQDVADCGTSTCDASFCESSGSSHKASCAEGGPCDCDPIGGKSEWERVVLDFACVNPGTCVSANFND